MELLEIFYIAIGTVGILIVLHLGTFWISRFMQPPQPKIIYVQQPAAAAPAPAPAPAPPSLSQAPPTIQLPTYDSPPRTENTAPVSTVAALPPPIETRNATKQSGGDVGAPR